MFIPRCTGGSPVVPGRGVWLCLLVGSAPKRDVSEYNVFRQQCATARPPPGPGPEQQEQLFREFLTHNCIYVLASILDIVTPALSILTTNTV